MDITTASAEKHFHIHADIAKTFSLAAQQNAYPLVKRVILAASSGDESVETQPQRSSLKNIRVRLKTDPEFIQPLEWLIDRLDPGQSTKLREQPVYPHFDKLAGLTEEQIVCITIEASYTQSDGEVGEETYRAEVTFLPTDYWGGESRQPELLAAFVQPNTHTVESLTAKVGQLLREKSKGSQIDGYQSNTRERPYLFGAALWAVLFNERLTYLSPPQGWAKQGQRIRSAQDILQYKTAACLDTSVLFASCFENMGLNPVIAMTRDHAFAGFWLIDESFPILTNDDPIDLKKRIDASDLVLFETTLATNDAPITFRQAIDHAKQLLSEENEQNFVMLIDIKHARSRRVKPLSIIEAKSSIEAITDPPDSGETIGIGIVPPLPPTGPGPIIPDTPQTRVEIWQRKLLDLTKRNPMLNIKSSALRLYCPDLGELEDNLAAGEKYNFLSSENSGLNDSDRSSENFLLTNGNDLHREFALDQLQRMRVIVNDTKKRMDNKLIELLRKAKNDLEEGGSNTLFLSLGMLRWRETPEAERSFRAPLILLPVKLERRSAQANITMRQLPDEEPIFNLTLIEMLQSDYDINLDSLRSDLPTDESGIDVVLIWNIVREAIKEQKGFIVEEEVVLGSFSFAKYLMWKDLRDRTALLTKSPFVEHLVERPVEVYRQDSNFISREQVDTELSPTEFFAPLNCDSSQMVAVSASAQPQDFVLEGPPGTGKSETISNIICHNIAKGRKVLFVAEKMAALQVVYRRMEKIGLSHLCLELHSNKANKKSVLDQLGAAWTHRESASQSEWLKRAESLGEIRQQLNQYVTELHKKGSLGLSPREAMARAVRFQCEHPLRVDWPTNLAQAPLKCVDDVEQFLSIASEMGIAYAEVADLDPSAFASIEQTEWSNQWKNSTVQLANNIFLTSEKLKTSALEVCELIGQPIDSITVTRAKNLSGLAELCNLVIQGNFDFALSSGGRKKVETLKQTAALQKDVLAAVSRFGHGLTWRLAKELTWDAWIIRRDASSGLFGFIKRYFLRRDITKAGLQKPNDLQILETGVIARDNLAELDKVARTIDGVEAWPGMDTDPIQVAINIEQADKAIQLFNAFSSAFPDPVQAAQKLRHHMVDGRDFLTESSQFYVKANQLICRFNDFSKLLDAAELQRININKSDSLTKIAQDFGVIADNSEKLGRWCRWLELKRKSENQGLEKLAQCLESKLVLPQNCEQNALTALCVWLAPILIDQSQILVRFAGSSHESMIDRFRELDKDVSATTADFIIAKTAGLIPDRDSNDTPPEYGLLARELTKKTKHKPVRALVTEMGESLTNLTPCFMMSPLSVAQFLPADFSLFDLVVFDEASQITTWDAVGAIARGKNVIVVGDPKQMPPSNNFGRKEDDDSDEGDLESILDQALAARLPHLRLTGHYRSRHETLIAFSNSHYYENALTTFPSAETKQSAVTLHRIDGVYAKGRGQTNSIEAKAVVAEVVRRLKGMLNDDPILTIGIVTINSQQQRMVEDFMDEARRENPDLEPFFNATDNFDPIFVKNLESVQGDERDIIILSLTYGPTESGAKTMSMNFGPLNKQGGERRLNVAVTRATTEVLVFSSFDSSMVDLSRTQATAIEHLKNYLEFAERGPVALTEYSTAQYGVDQFDSDFEHAVAIALRAKGWKVQTQVGVSKFRVDLGIIHPDYPGEYLAGVECDGATYHGSPSARDRDRVRQAILENLGWRIIRLWSTDYFQDPNFAMTGIHKKLEAALNNDRAKRESQSKIAVEDVPSESDGSAIDEKKATNDDETRGAKDSDNAGNHDSQSYKNTMNQRKAAILKLPLVEEQNEDGADIVEDALSDLPQYSKDQFFDDSHKKNLSDLAREILTRKNGITLHELTQDVASLHGLARSSRKQRQHLRSVITPWAGLWRAGEAKTTVWLSPNDKCEEIPWRGLLAFGTERDWRDLCYQEQSGFARAAILAQPDAPVEWMFDEFKIRRRHEGTAKEFSSWLERIDNQKHRGQI